MIELKKLDISSNLQFHSYKASAAYAVIENHVIFLSLPDGNEVLQNLSAASTHVPWQGCPHSRGRFSSLGGADAFLNSIQLLLSIDLSKIQEIHLLLYKNNYINHAASSVKYAIYRIGN